jgi:simple sugar transport system ATP-binding protein
MAITDNVSIMRGGKMVGHRKTSDTNPQELAELMVGRKVLLNVEKPKAKPKDVALNVKNLGMLLITRT